MNRLNTNNRDGRKKNPTSGYVLLVGFLRSRHGLGVRRPFETWAQYKHALYGNPRWKWNYPIFISPRSNIRKIIAGNSWLNKTMPETLIRPLTRDRDRHKDRTRSLPFHRLNKSDLVRSAWLKY